MASKFKAWCDHRKPGEVFAFVCKQEVKDFQGFHLRIGHIYGCDDNGIFVAAPCGKPQDLKGRPIRIYRQYHAYYNPQVDTVIAKSTSGKDIERHSFTPSQLDYQWVTESVKINSATGQTILRLSRNKKGVYFGSISEQVQAIYNPRLTTEKYTRMKYARIPSGVRTPEPQHNCKFVENLNKKGKNHE